MKRMMLYFGSFNPIHRGHIALAEYVVEHDLCDEVALIVSPQSPYKATESLVPELNRFEMAEIACATSKYPESIRPSAIEFVLTRPSYTIDTLRYLTENFGSEMLFSILMGGDQIKALDGWKEYEKILEYPIFVYPRPNEKIERFLDRITVLNDAPLFDISATEIRRRILCGEETSTLLIPEVERYIREKGLWSPATQIATLTARIAENPQDHALYLERGKLHYRQNEWGSALNDFHQVLQIDPDHIEAKQFSEITREILEFRYKDIYNP
ncbi:MAG: nicotinate (nicotinamide) nucleotide adenylyltransferase [Rikenellaceae bacterium]|nr:nicotinate (nicotinamide) nucleotide adenylyltransferase [Rikenellaceae bacterium]